MEEELDLNKEEASDDDSDVIIIVTPSNVSSSTSASDAISTERILSSPRITPSSEIPASPALQSSPLTKEELIQATIQQFYTGQEKELNEDDASDIGSEYSDKGEGRLAFDDILAFYSQQCDDENDVLAAWGEEEDDFAEFEEPDSPNLTASPSPLQATSSYLPKSPSPTPPPPSPTTPAVSAEIISEIIKAPEPPKRRIVPTLIQPQNDPPPAPTTAPKPVQHLKELEQKLNKYITDKTIELEQQVRKDSDAIYRRFIKQDKQMLQDSLKMYRQQLEKFKEGILLSADEEPSSSTFSAVDTCISNIVTTSLVLELKDCPPISVARQKPSKTNSSPPQKRRRSENEDFSDFIDDEGGEDEIIDLDDLEEEEEVMEERTDEQPLVLYKDTKQKITEFQKMLKAVATTSGSLERFKERFKPADVTHFKYFMKDWKERTTRGFLDSIIKEQEIHRRRTEKKPRAKPNTVDVQRIEFEGPRKKQRKSAPTIDEPEESVSLVLKPHQSEAIEFLSNRLISKSGAILAHSMGLGKTITTLQIIAKHLGSTWNKVIITVPKSVLLNWHREYKRFCHTTVQKRLFIVQNKDDREKVVSWIDSKDPAILLCTHTKLRTFLAQYDGTKEEPGNQESKTRVKIFSALTDESLLLVVDEADILKNHDSQTAVAFSKLKTPYKLALTGALIQNNLLEYYAILSFTNPGLLGTPEQFYAQFVRCIEESRAVDNVRLKILQKLNLKVAHRKDESYLAAQLSENQSVVKHDMVVFVSLSDAQKDAYRKLHALLEKYQKNFSSFITFYHLFSKICNHLQALTWQPKAKKRDREEEAKQASASASALAKTIHQGSSEDNEEVEDEEEVEDGGKAELEENDGTPEDTKQLLQLLLPNITIPEDHFECSSKLKFCYDMVLKAHSAKEKTLIFSQSIAALDMIENFFMNSDVGPSVSHTNRKFMAERDYLRIDGGTTTIARQHAITEFNSNDDIFFMLLSKTAGGVGINLTTATRVIIFDAHFNPAKDSQASCRAYRLGQKKNVHVYRLIAKGTFEEDIHLASVRKQKLFNIVLDEKNHKLKQKFKISFRPFFDEVDVPKNYKVKIKAKDKLLFDALSTDNNSSVLDIKEYSSLFEDKVIEVEDDEVEQTIAKNAFLKDVFVKLEKKPVSRKR